MNAVTISADSHICEIPDLFTSRVDRGLRDQVPYLAHDDKLGDAWNFPNGMVTSLAAFASAGAWQGKTTSAMSFAEVPRSAWDPVARPHAMATDGVAAEVLYPSYAMQIFSTVKDASVQMACARAYNDWLHQIRPAAERFFQASDQVRVPGRSARDSDPGNHRSDVLMWGSDYPHNDSTFPDSQRVIAEMFRGVPEADREKIIHSNAAKLYQFA